MGFRTGQLSSGASGEKKIGKTFKIVIGLRRPNPLSKCQQKTETKKLLTDVGQNNFDLSQAFLLYVPKFEEPYGTVQNVASFTL